MGRWRRKSSERLQRCRVFDIDRVTFEPPQGPPDRTFYSIVAPDWINVIPLADDRTVRLIRQFRFGVDEFTWEIPGGMCDPGETPLATAQRELREETGGIADRWVELGWVHPNPAIQNNRCHSFLALGTRYTAEPQPDANEAFEPLDVLLDDIPQWIADRKITHSLVVAAFHLLRPDHLK